jgi:uncharacterized repeat protein (TIGR01451 family)/LPXTG-motif cell wall-anchored protein
MKTNMTKKLLVGTALLVSLIAPSLASANYAQPEPPSRKILVNKLVFNPGNNQFVDNLSVDQHQFLPDQEVLFRVQVTNTSNVDLENIDVTDKLPSQLNFVTGPGEFDDDAYSLNFSIDKLTPNQTKTFDIKAKVKGANDIPANVFCITNLAEAKVDELMDQDTANICLNKQVLGVTKELPKTGPSATNNILFASTAALGLSVFLFRKAKI